METHGTLFPVLSWQVFFSVNKAELLTLTTGLLKAFHFMTMVGRGWFIMCHSLDVQRLQGIFRFVNVVEKLLDLAKIWTSASIHAKHSANEVDDSLEKVGVSCKSLFISYDSSLLFVLMVFLVFSVLSLGVFACQYISLLLLSMSLKKVTIQKNKNINTNLNRQHDTARMYTWS